MLTVKINALAYGGAGVGQIQAGRQDLIGKICFVKFAVPGEIVEVELVDESGSYVNARLVNILEPSKERVKPECPYFGVCGGCDLQHMSIQAQREAKRLMVETMLSQKLKLQLPSPVTLLAPQLPAFRYRKRIGLHVAPSGEIGFYRSSSGDVVDIQNCIIADERINACLGQIRGVSEQIKDSIAAIEIECEETTNLLFEIREGLALSDKVRNIVSQLSPNVVVSAGRKVLYSQINSLPSQANELAIGHFSQVNNEGNSHLINEVLNELQTDTITEFYAGAGNFSVPLARRGSAVTAIEADALLVEQGKQRAEKAGLGDKLQFVHRSAEKYAKSKQLCSGVLLDPPRSGAREVVTRINPKVSSQVVYVSCNLPTLARDLKVLCEAGFMIRRVAILDMFPQTHHIEIIVSLQSAT